MKFRYLILLSALVWTGCDDDTANTTPPLVTGTRLEKVTVYYLNQAGDYGPGELSEYFYSATGALVKLDDSTYDIMEKEFVDISTTNFSYLDGRLSKVDRVSADGQHSITTYHYNGSVLSGMSLDDQSGVDTEASIQYEADTIQVFYAHSNGRSFTYRFSTIGDNIGFEKTIDDSHKLSSKTINEFDEGLNPYSLLQYTDMFFTNFSKNNKISSTGEYFTHQPQSVPSEFEYVYGDDHELPLEQYVTYKSYPGGVEAGRTKVIFEYSE